MPADGSGSVSVKNHISDREALDSTVLVLYMQFANTISKPKVQLLRSIILMSKEQSL